MIVFDYIGSIFYAAFFIVMFIIAVYVLFDYLKERAEKSSQKELSGENNDSSFEISEESRIVTDLGDIVYFINISSVGIRKLNNPDLCYALEELKNASAHTLAAMQCIVDLNYPVDEEEFGCE